MFASAFGLADSVQAPRLGGAKSTSQAPPVGSTCSRLAWRARTLLLM